MSVARLPGRRACTTGARRSAWTIEPDAVGPHDRGVACTGAATQPAGLDDRGEAAGEHDVDDDDDDDGGCAGGGAGRLACKAAWPARPKRGARLARPRRTLLGRRPAQPRRRRRAAGRPIRTTDGMAARPTRARHGGVTLTTWARRPGPHDSGEAAGPHDRADAAGERDHRDKAAWPHNSAARRLACTSSARR
jgi:hypothetical protein